MKIKTIRPDIEELQEMIANERDRTALAVGIGMILAIIAITVLSFIGMI